MTQRTVSNWITCPRIIPSSLPNLRNKPLSSLFPPKAPLTAGLIWWRFLRASKLLTWFSHFRSPNRSHPLVWQQKRSIDFKRHVEAKPQNIFAFDTCMCVCAFGLGKWLHCPSLCIATVQARARSNLIPLTCKFMGLKSLPKTRFPPFDPARSNRPSEAPKPPRLRGEAGAKHSRHNLSLH